MASTTRKAAPAANPTTPDTQAFGDIGRLIERFVQMPGINVDGLVEWQRRDLAALAEANRQAFEAACFGQIPEARAPDGGRGDSARPRGAPA